MAQLDNKIVILRKPEAIESALAVQRRSQVATARQELALLINLGADDTLSHAVNKVFQRVVNGRAAQSILTRLKSRKPSKRRSLCCRANVAPEERTKPQSAVGVCAAKEKCRGAMASH
jgi:hypothetical protein